MADMNEYTGDNWALHDLCVETDLVDTVALLNPDIETYPTYMYGRKQIDYIFTTPAFSGVALKGHVTSSTSM